MNQEKNTTDPMSSDYAIELYDQHGNVVMFDFLDLVKLDDEEYIVLDPLEANDDTPVEVVILEIEKGADGETDSYCSVEDERILEQVFDIFRHRNQDRFDFAE